MSVVKFRKRVKPFRELIHPDFSEMDEFFKNRFWQSRFLTDRFWNSRRNEPGLNIKETQNHFEIEVAAPGFSKQDFNITIVNGRLVISAEKSEKVEEVQKDYTRREFIYNAFERSLILPENINGEDIKAKYKDGILSLKLAKKEEDKQLKTKQVEIT